MILLKDKSDKDKRRRWMMNGRIEWDEIQIGWNKNHIFPFDILSFLFMEKFKTSCSPLTLHHSIKSKFSAI